MKREPGRRGAVQTEGRKRGRRKPMHTEEATMAKPKRRNPEPFIDWSNTYRADQLVWVHDGGSWDVIAVREEI